MGPHLQLPLVPVAAKVDGQAHRAPFQVGPWDKFVKDVVYGYVLSHHSNPGAQVVVGERTSAAARA